MVLLPVTNRNFYQKLRAAARRLRNFDGAAVSIHYNFVANC